MIAFLAVIATIGALSSVARLVIARLVIAWLDYRRRWCDLPPAFYGRKRG